MYVGRRYCLTNERKILRTELQYKKPLSQQRDPLIHYSCGNCFREEYTSLVTESNNDYLVEYFVGLFRGAILSSFVKSLREHNKNVVMK